MIAMAKHKPASLPAVLPEGRLVHVSFEVRLPATATPDQVEDWLNLHMGCGGMDGDNPLMTHAPEPFTGEVVLTDTRRSEEHTSELQSLLRISYAVFCWKKKKVY